MRFSILIPAFKAKYLKECLDSILSQTFKDFEIIIVNDASPENIDEIISLYSDERIHYYKNKNNCGAINVVDNWNKCLNLSCGEYIICMGDDDKLISNCLEEYDRLINKYSNLNIYHGWTEIIDENSNVTRLQEARPEYESVYSLIWHRWHGRVQYIGDFLFKSDYLKNLGGFYKLPLAWASDDISANLAAQRHGIANSQTPIFQYRINSNTISNTGNVNIKLQSIIHEKKWYSAFLRAEPNEYCARIYRKMILESFSSYFDKKVGLTLSRDMKTGSILLKSLYWFKHMKEFEISKKALMYGIIHSLK